jgi:hypothetical protein
MQNGWGALATAAPHELHGNLGFMAISASWQSQQLGFGNLSKRSTGNLDGSNSAISTQY